MRLFLALELGESTRRGLAGWAARALCGRGDLRTVAAPALHVTLVFLGATAPSRVPAIWRAAAGACAGHRAPALGPIGIRAVPRRRPRLLALDLTDEDGRARALYAAVTGALGSEGLHTLEGRPFWAHVTLARVRRGARFARLDIEPPRTGTLRPTALVLYRSHLSPEGSRYEVLERHTLPA